MRIRRLTPVECARLQSFPDDWCATLSDTQAYKCYGNAMTVNVVQAVIAQLFTSEEKEMIQNTKAELADGGKTHSQRLRGVLYMNWHNDPEGYAEFHDYYIVKMQKIINHLKSKHP